VPVQLSEVREQPDSHSKDEVPATPQVSSVQVPVLTAPSPAVQATRVVEVLSSHWLGRSLVPVQLSGTAGVWEQPDSHCEDEVPATPQVSAVQIPSPSSVVAPSLSASAAPSPAVQSASVVEVLSSHWLGRSLVPVQLSGTAGVWEQPDSHCEDEVPVSPQVSAVQTPSSGAPAPAVQVAWVVEVPSSHWLGRSLMPVQVSAADVHPVRQLAVPSVAASRSQVGVKEVHDAII
jgi:hypothetical protein